MVYDSNCNVSANHKDHVDGGDSFADSICKVLRQEERQVVITFVNDVGDSDCLIMQTD